MDTFNLPNTNCQVNFCGFYFHYVYKYSLVVINCIMHIIDQLITKIYGISMYM